MDCDLCGKPATAKATIEGAQLSVCAACARHGTNVRPLPQQATQKKQTISSREPREELIETVRPDVAKLLRLHREKLKLNQEQFAAKLQLRASTYNHYESGTVVPDIATARRFEHELKTPLVVHIKVANTVQTHDEQRSMTMADFIKKK